MRGADALMGRGMLRTQDVSRRVDRVTGLLNGKGINAH
jgi:hypothetical protein